MIVYLLAPDLRTLGGFEGQLAALATGLAEIGHTVRVFVREPVVADHPLRLKMIEAGVSVSAPPAWLARALDAPIRRRLRWLLMWAASPLICLFVAANSLRAGHGWLRAWRDSWTRLLAALGPLTELDALTWHLETRLDRARAQAPPDIIDVQHSMLPRGIRYARRRDLPVVYTEYGAPSMDLESVWAGLRPVINDADFIVGRAQASLAGLQRVCGSTVSGIVIPNAVTTTPASADCEEPSDRDGRLVITAIGRLAPEKGLRYLLEALRHLVAAGVPVRLVLAGEGPLRATLTEQARAWGLDEHLTLLGAFGDVDSVLRSTHLVAHPSLNDGRSVAVLEAMAWGRAIVATRVGGLPELIVDGETGLLVPPGDAPALARALETLAADPVLRRRLGRAAREHFLAGEFTAETMVEATVKVYDQVIGAHASRAARPPAR